MPQSCFCEEHCSWEICRLVDAPEKCLNDVESFWSWDENKYLWVAQKGGMMQEFYFLMFLALNFAVSFGFSN